MASSGEFFVGPADQPDKYRLVHQVGAGGEAQLWRAELDVSGTWEPVAVKILRPDRLADLEHWKERWSEQAEVLRFVRHPGVVGVREHFEGAAMHYAGETQAGANALYLVMNWVDGVALRDWVPLHRTTDDYVEAMRYLAQVGDVLDWLHSGQATPSGRPIIHADVTPGNVIVTPSGQAVLVDFGLTRLATATSPVVEGTRGYMAPEVLANGAYSPASDRYSFGALTYFVLTGQQPPVDENAIRAGFEAVPALAGQPDVVAHLMRMFSPNSDDRPPAGDWIRFFRMSGTTSIGAGDGLAPTVPMAAATAVAPLPVPEKEKSKRALVIAAIAVAVLLIGGGVALALSGGHSNKNAGAGTVTTTTLVQDTTTVSDTSAETTTVPDTSDSSNGDTSDPSNVQNPTGSGFFVSAVSTSGGTQDPQTGAATINGKTFPNSLWDAFSSCDSEEVTFSHDYDLGRQYSTFKATIGQIDTSPRNYSIQWDVYLDTNTHKGPYNLIQGQSQEINIPVKNVLTLTLQVTHIPNSSNDNPSNCGDIDAAWGDAQVAP